MSHPLAEKVEEIARPIVESSEGFIIEVKIRGERTGRVIELFVDTDSGVTTDLCSEISRKLSRELDLAGIVQGRYHLIVSSPGTDRPLTYLRQYPQHVGRTLRVKRRLNGQVEQLEGELLRVLPEGIRLRLRDDAEVDLLLDEILEAQVKPAW